MRKIQKPCFKHFVKRRTMKQMVGDKCTVVSKNKTVILLIPRKESIWNAPEVVLQSLSKLPTTMKVWQKFSP
jgi:hypothetical protein